MIKGSICQDIAILNVHVPYDKASNYMEEKVARNKRRNRQIHNYVGDFNISLSVIARTSTQNINKDIEDLNNIINQIDLIDP